MTPARRRPPLLTRRRAAAAVAALAVPALLAACGGGLGEQAATGDQKGYVGDAGTFRYVAPAQRGAPVDLRGTTADGRAVDAAAWRGSVVVVNVWYAGCAPCRAEAPELAAVASRTAAEGVRFVGVNTRDDAGTVLAFQRRFGLPYASVLDAGSGQALLSLRGQVPPQAVPSTVVLDAQGRPAARYLGRLEPGILDGLVEDVRTGRAGTSAGTSTSTSAVTAGAGA